MKQYDVEELLAGDPLTDIVQSTDNEKNVVSEESDSEESVVQCNLQQIDDMLNKINDLQNLILMVFSFLPRNVHFI